MCALQGICNHTTPEFNEIFDHSDIWKEVYTCVKTTIDSSTIDPPASSRVVWPDRVDKLESKHLAAVTAATEKLLSKLLVPADPVAVTALGDAVSKEDLDTLTKGHMPSSLMDLCLKWISRQSGSKFLDVDGLQDLSYPVTLESATPTDWQGTQRPRRTIVASTTIGLNLLRKNSLNSSLVGIVKNGLSDTRAPTNFAIVKTSDAHWDGVWVTVSPQQKTVPVQYLAAGKPECKVLGDVLNQAKLKSKNFSYTSSGEADVWSVLAKIVTHIFGNFGASGTASTETLSILLRFLLVHFISKVLARGASQEPAAGSSMTTGGHGDGGSGGSTGGGSVHDNNPGNNNNSNEGGDKGSGGGSGSCGGSDGDQGSSRGSDGGKTMGQTLPLLAASDVTAPRMMWKMCRQNASSSARDTENIDPQIGRQTTGLQTSKEGLEETELDEGELWKADRDGLLAAAELEYGKQGGKWSKTLAAITDRILLEFQLVDCSIQSLLSVTVGRGGVLTVLCQYNGTNQYVVGGNRMMNPGGRFELWISALREKGRWKNDAVLRHAVNWLSFDGRTKHTPEIHSLVAPPLRLLKRRAFMGFASLDGPRQKNKSLGSTFLAVKHEGVQLQAAIRSDMSKRVDSGALVLTDGVRRSAQILEHAVANCNRYGLALGNAAIDDVRVDEHGNPVFRNLSGSCTFPADNTGPMSFQAAKNPPFLHRANTSRSWADDAVKGKAGRTVTIHHLDDPIVLQTMSTQIGGQGYSNLNDATDTLLANAEKDSTNARDLANAKRGKANAKKDTAQEKAAAYCVDQRSLALMFAKVLCDPVNSQDPSKLAELRDELLDYSTQTTILRNMVKEGSTHARSKTQEADRIAGIKQSKTRQLEAKFRSGLEEAGILFSDESLAKGASWVLESFDSQLSIKSSSSAANPATGLAFHEFLTTYTFTRDQMEALRNEGILIGPCVVACGEYMPAECKFVGKSLPAVRARIQSGKGTGLEAGQELSDGELIGFYDGPCVRAAEDVPSSRMVLRLTASKYEHWAYCIGEEDFEKCKAIHALFSYANAPGRGEVVNCRVARTEECRYTVGGQARVFVPVYAIGSVPDGTPLYWDYPPTAGPGMCI